MIRHSLLWSGVGVFLPVLILGYMTRNESLSTMLAGTLCIVFANLMGFYEAMIWSRRLHKKIAAQMEKLANFLRDHAEEEKAKEGQKPS